MWRGDCVIGPRGSIDVTPFAATTYALDDYFRKLSEEQYDFMQYTSLKDKNGKEIYEGDIVSFPRLENTNGKSKVVFSEGEFRVEKGDQSLNLYNAHCQTIGNIYENPHLLETVEK